MQLTFTVKMNNNPGFSNSALRRGFLTMESFYSGFLISILWLLLPKVLSILLFFQIPFRYRPLWTFYSAIQWTFSAVRDSPPLQVQVLYQLLFSKTFHSSAFPDILLRIPFPLSFSKPCRVFCSLLQDNTQKTVSLITDHLWQYFFLCKKSY